MQQLMLTSGLVAGGVLSVDAANSLLKYARPLCTKTKTMYRRWRDRHMELRKVEIHEATELKKVEIHEAAETARTKAQENSKTERLDRREAAKTERAQLKYGTQVLQILTNAMERGSPLTPELFGEGHGEAASRFPLGTLATPVVPGGGSGTGVSGELLRGGEVRAGIQEIADDRRPDLVRAESSDASRPLSPLDGDIRDVASHRPEDDPSVPQDR